MPSASVTIIQIDILQKTSQTQYCRHKARQLSTVSVIDWQALSVMQMKVSSPVMLVTNSSQYKGAERVCNSPALGTSPSHFLPTNTLWCERLAINQDSQLKSKDSILVNKPNCCCKKSRPEHLLPVGCTGCWRLATLSIVPNVSPTGAAQKYKGETEIFENVIYDVSATFKSLQSKVSAGKCLISMFNLRPACRMMLLISHDIDIDMGLTWVPAAAGDRIVTHFSAADI